MKWEFGLKSTCHLCCLYFYLVQSYFQRYFCCAYNEDWGQTLYLLAHIQRQLCIYGCVTVYHMYKGMWIFWFARIQLQSTWNMAVMRAVIMIALWQECWCWMLVAVIFIYFPIPGWRHTYMLTTIQIVNWRSTCDSEQNSTNKCMHISTMVQHKVQVTGHLYLQKLECNCLEQVSRSCSTRASRPVWEVILR